MVAACMLFTSIRGADFGRYQQWAAALRAGDIFLIQSSVGSPLGIPLTHWLPGTGMVFALPQVVLGDVVDPTNGALVAGWLSILVFWWAFFRILVWASRNDFTLTAWGAGVVFLGTHVGFLSRAYASETLAIALVALLIATMIDPNRGLIASSWTVACSTAMLIATRSYYAVYALPALVLVVGRILDLDFARVDTEDGSRREPRYRWLAAISLSAPLLIAIVGQGLLNRWMTGSVTSSPYLFGDSTYRSVDLLSPLFWPVLAHPWHGLLVYHPLYALALAAALMCLVRSTSVRERIIWAGAIVAVMVNLWIQAAWFVWWLGTVTFGMRGMAPAAVVLVPALVRLVADARFTGDHGRSGGRRAWVLLATLACLWSFLIILQGTSQFYTSGDVFAGQWATLAGLLEPERVGSLLGAAIVVAGAWLWAKRRGQLADTDAETIVAAAVLCVLSVAYVLMMTFARWNSGNLALFLPAVLMLVLIGSVSVAVRWVIGGSGAGGRYARGQPSVSDELTPPLALLWTTLVIVVSAVLFVRLAGATERRIAAGDIPDRVYRYTASFEVQRALVSLREYQRIEGFEDRKEALRRYLLSQGAEPGR